MILGRHEDDVAAVDRFECRRRAPIETTAASHYISSDSDGGHGNDFAQHWAYERALGLPQRTATVPKTVKCHGCKALMAPRKTGSSLCELCQL